MTDRLTSVFSATIENAEDCVTVRVEQNGTDAYVVVHIPKSLNEEQMEGFETMIAELHTTVGMMMTVITDDDIDVLETNDDQPVTVRVEKAP